MWKKNNVEKNDVEYINSCSFIPWRELENKTVFVTGASGFVGQNLINGLLYVNAKRNLNMKILGLVRSIEKAKKIFDLQPKYLDALEFVIGDIRTFEYPKQNIDYIIHGASITSSKDFVEKSEEVKSIAIDGTNHLLELAKIKNVLSFVYLSSMEVYGYPKKGHICREDESWDFDSKVKRNSYPIAKHECENICKEYYNNNGLPIKIVRLAQTFGPRKGLDNRLFSYFEKCINNNEDIVFKTRARSERCYIYITDAVTGILTVLLNGKDNDIYNLANSSMYCSVSEIAKKAILYNNSKINISYDIDNNYYPDENYLLLDTQKITSLKWKPNYSYDSIKYMSKNRKNILVVTTSLGNDGAERVLSELCNEWIELGQNVALVQIFGSKNVTYKLSNKVKIINIEKGNYTKANRFIKYIFVLRELIRILKNHKEYTIISFLPIAQFMVYISSLFINNRIIFSERNDPNMWPNSSIKRKLRDTAFLCADVCVFQTEYAMNHFPKKIRNKGIIIKNPISRDIPDIYCGVKRKAIVCVCRLEKQKNIPLLIDAFESFHLDHPEYILEIYGKGKEEIKIKNILKNKNLTNYVHLCGFVNDVFEKIKSASIFVLSSNYEGIPNSLLEAMALGIPVVCTDCPVYGVREIIDNKINGYLVNTNDRNELKKAMKEIVELDDIGLQNLCNSAQKIRKEYNISKISESWLKIV